MSYTVVPQKWSVGSLSSAISVTAFANGPDTIAATNIGASATRGDAVEVVGSTSNDAVYIVLDVLDADTLEVWPAPTVEAAAGTARLYHPNHNLDIVDETTVTAATIAAAVPDARMFQRVIRTACGTISPQTWDIYSFLFNLFTLRRTGAGTTTLTSEREVWYRDYDGTVRSGSGFRTDWLVVSDHSGNGDIDVRFGDVSDAADYRTVEDGCVLLGGGPQCDSTPPGDMSARVLGSFLGGAAQTLILDDANLVGALAGCVSYSNIFAPTSGGSLAVLRDIIYSPPGNALPMVGAPDEVANLLIANNGNSGVLANAPDEVLVRQVELSDDAVTPLLLLFNSAARFVDPRGPYTAAQLFVAFTSGAGRLGYTWNQRLVDFSLLKGPVPVPGALVSIDRYTDARLVNVASNTDGTYTITINGEDHTYVASGDAASTIKTELADAINAGGQPVTATAESAPAMFGDAIAIKSDVDNEIFEISVDSPSGDLVLDPSPVAGGANITDARWIPGPVTGSPFTTDADGRINSGAGFVMDRFLTYTFLGTANFWYRVRVEKVGFVAKDSTVQLNATDFGDYPLRLAQMGVF